MLGLGRAVPFTLSRNLNVLACPGIFRHLTVFRLWLRTHLQIPASEISSARARLRMLEHWPPVGAGLHQVTIGSRLASQSPKHRFVHCPTLPNYSFKPRPLRGSAYALSCSTTPRRYAVRLNSGVMPLKSLCCGWFPATSRCSPRQAFVPLQLICRGCGQHRCPVLGLRA